MKNTKLKKLQVLLGLVPQSFGYMTTDGVEIEIEDDAMEMGKKVYIITPEGHLPIPDGEYEMEMGAKLKTMGGVIEKMETLNPNVCFTFMGFDKLLESNFPFSNVKFVEWSEEEEIAFLSNIDLGIMPLRDTPFNQGKCGFKLIQYMAMGKPTISTPLMANVKINRNNQNMFASSIDEWFDCINNYINNKKYFEEVGFNNINIVKKYYSVEGNVSIYIQLLNKLKDVRN
jgi:glycosyltransferase involved in cell wall biosynthesis